MHIGISITILPVAILYSPADMREQLKNHPVAPITRIFLWTILVSLSYPRLIGIQYAIIPKDYNSLPAQEKPNWYILDKTLLTQTKPQFPELNAQQISMVLPHLLGNYAKLIITWNPLDNLPISAKTN